MHGANGAVVEFGSNTNVAEEDFAVEVGRRVLGGVSADGFYQVTADEGNGGLSSGSKGNLPTVFYDEAYGASVELTEGV